ncbi:MAG: ATP-dependent RecD-like DNA helicase [Desulfobacteraceae bacterium]
MITISGTLQRITFRNDTNHYTIARLKIANVTEPVVVVGHLPGTAQGETVKLSGKWVTHPKFGEQFKVEAFEVTLPATVSGIKKYLGSGIIKGIGKSMAERIVNGFQEEALEIIENQPERLKEIDGIGKAKARTVAKAWEKHHAVRKIMKFLQDRGVGPSHASAILQFYGTDSMEVLKNSPYSVSRDVPGAGFEVADTIALNAGGKKDDPERIMASLVYLILQYEKQGHVFIKKETLLQQCIALTGADLGLVEESLTSLCKQREIVIEKCEEPGGEQVYLKRLHRAEKGIADKLTAMLSVAMPDQEMDQEVITREIFQRLGIKLSGEQIDIVQQILSHRVVIITGGPGTGKTTLIRAVYAIFQKRHHRIVLSAPTGRAARRLSEVTGKKASTLHKLLLYDLEKQCFGKNTANPLDLDVLVVDEASMVDTMLMFSLVEALPADSVLIVVGDIFQLPSVGPGCVLSDLIASQAIKTFFLTRIFRQAEESPIVMNAHCIRNGEMPLLKREDQKGTLSEFYFIENNAPERVVDTILQLAHTRIRKAFPHIEEIQVLTPMHKGDAGTINLNQRLQEVLNPVPGGIQSGGITFRIGDKVMHLKNNYEKEVFNGDIGVVHDVVKSESRIEVDFDGRIVDYDVVELDELTLAYAVTVHKSQGSEYDAVVIALTTMHFPLLQRNLLYTGMTRGKNLVIIVGSTRALEIALNNNRTDLRLSGLKNRF